MFAFAEAPTSRAILAPGSRSAMMGEGVTQRTLDHNGGTQVSLGGSPERVMREERKDQEGALG